MAAGKTTSKLVAVYNKTAEVTLFLAGFFRSPARNFHTSERVEIDIVRNDEDVAIVITDLSTGARLNSDDLYTNKEFKPPIFDEEGTLNSFDLIGRQPGQTPYDEPDFKRNAILRSFDMFRKLEAKIRRSIELMASQVLQEGKVTLRDKNGVALYTIDFGAKVANFPDANVAWDEAGADPLLDLQNLAESIRSTGLVDPDTVIMGDTAYRFYLRNAIVKAELDNRKINNSEAAPESRGKGATFQGYHWVGSYRFAIWTYNGRYKDPQTGVSTRYVHPNKVIMLSSTSTVLDLTFGAIPRIVSPESRVLPFLPPRIPNAEGGMDLSTFAWVTPDGKQVKVSAGTRPLTIPTGIDTFGCLDTLIGE